MSMHAKRNLAQAPGETQSPAVSLLTQSASLCLVPTANTHFRPRTHSFCTSETLKAWAHNVRHPVLSCWATCFQIKRSVKKRTFILHLIGRASRLIPKVFSKSYFCMHNSEGKHQDMEILSSLIGATAWSIFKLCELHLATKKNVTTVAKCGKLDSENRQNDF